MYKFVVMGSEIGSMPLKRRQVILSGKIKDPDKDITTHKLKGDSYQSMYRIVTAKGDIIYLNTYDVGEFRFIPI